MEKIQRALEKARRDRGSDKFRHPLRGGIASPMGAAEDGTSMPGPSVITTEVVSTEVLKAQRVVAGLNVIETTDAFRMLRTQVMGRLTASNASTLAITSPGPGEGKTVLAANLAISLSRLAHCRVLLVDVDLRRPAVHTVFGLSPRKGLTDYLLHDAPLRDCLISPGMERLVLLPCGTGSEMSSEILSSARMASLAAELKSHYSDGIVLYDLPPLLVTDDALVFLKRVDACLLVVEQGATRRAGVERCLELLQDFNVIGTVLNKFYASQHGYGYGYGYGY